MYYNGDVSDDIAFFSALDGKSFDDVDQKLKGRVPDKNRIEFMRSYKRMCSNKEIISQYEKDILDREAYKMMLEDAMNDAKIEGHAAGREEGLEKGREEGFAKGIAEGIEQNTIKMVSEMIQQNIPYDTISKVSGLTNEKIIEIEKSIGNWMGMNNFYSFFLFSNTNQLFLIFVHIKEIAKINIIRNIN